MNAPVKHQSQHSESVLTTQVRGAYPFVHEKRTKRANGTPLQKPRNDITLLFPKLNADPAQCANYQFLSKLCMEAATKAWGSWPQGGHWPIQDGDAPPKPRAPVPGQAAAPVDPNKYVWRKGNWVIEATNYLEQGPRVAVMQNGQAVELPTRMIAGKSLYKSGDYCIASIHAFTFQNEKFGVNFGFDGVLWIGEGQAIGSSGPKSAAQMFGGVATFAQPAAAPGPQPMPGPQPAAAPGSQNYAPQPSPAPAYAPPQPAPGGYTAPQPPAAPAAPPAMPAAPGPLAPPPAPPAPAAPPPGLPLFPNR